MYLPQEQASYGKHCRWNVWGISRTPVCITGTFWSLHRYALCVQRAHPLPPPPCSWTSTFVPPLSLLPGLVHPPIFCPGIPVPPSHSLGPSQLINGLLVLLLICISSVDGALTLCYTHVMDFFFGSLFQFWLWYPKALNLVLISFEKLHPSKDDIHVVLF